MNDCKGNCPPKEFDEKRYCKECRKIKAKCKAGINCKGKKLRKDHDEDGFCSDCNNDANCKSGFCGGNKPLKDHNDKGYCTNCLDKNHKCNKDPHNTCPGDKLLKEHDDNGICPSCNDKKVNCRFSSCSNSTVAFKDFDSNGYCAACGAKKQACKANHPDNICPGNQLLKDHDENGICSDCSADKTKKLKIDMMDFRDLKPLIEKFKDLDVGIQQSDIDSLDDSKINKIRTYFTELQRLGIYKGTIGERDVIDLNNTSFIDTNFNKSSLGRVYHLVGNTWTSKLASTYTNLRLKKPFKITDKAFRLLMDHTLTFVFIEGTGDSITVLIKSTEIT